jgi:hypothetical protein
MIERWNGPSPLAEDGFIGQLLRNLDLEALAHTPQNLDAHHRYVSSRSHLLPHEHLSPRQRPKGNASFSQRRFHISVWRDYHRRLALELRPFISINKKTFSSSESIIQDLGCTRAEQVHYTVDKDGKESRRLRHLKWLEGNYQEWWTIIGEII